MTRSAILTALAAMLATGAPAAGLHPEATLKSARSAAPAGSALALTGENFAADGSYLLVLRGALGEYPLGETTATSAGTLALSLAIPADVRPGRYQLVALADDGDLVARLDLAIEPPAPAAAAGEDAMAHEQTGAHEAMGRAGDLPIERSRSGIEWGILGLIIGLAGGLGAGFLRRAA